MVIDNPTKYRSDDLRRIILAGLAATGTSEPRSVRIRYSRTHRPENGAWHGGWAAYSGRQMQLTLPSNPAKVDPLAFARTLVHEAAHLRGIKHGDMAPDVMYPWTLPVPWAEGMAIRVREEAAEPVAVIDLSAERAKRSEKREAQLRDRLDDTERKIARLDRKRARLAKSLRYYDRKRAAMTAPESSDV